MKKQKHNSSGELILRAQKLALLEAFITQGWECRAMRIYFRCRLALRSPACFFTTCRRCGFQFSEGVFR